MSDESETTLGLQDCLSHYYPELAAMFGTATMSLAVESADNQTPLVWGLLGASSLITAAQTLRKHRTLKRQREACQSGYELISQLEPMIAKLIKTRILSHITPNEWAEFTREGIWSYQTTESIAADGKKRSLIEVGKILPVEEVEGKFHGMPISMPYSNYNMVLSLLFDPANLQAPYLVLLNQRYCDPIRNERGRIISSLDMFILTQPQYKPTDGPPPNTIIADLANDNPHRYQPSQDGRGFQVGLPADWSYYKPLSALSRFGREISNQDNTLTFTQAFADSLDMEVKLFHAGFVDRN